jgi:hypothetical protein
MKYLGKLTIIGRNAFPTYLLLAMPLWLAGCSATIPTVPQESSLSCQTVPGEALPQHAIDDCRKELCVEGRLTSIEDLTENAPVSDWAEEIFCFFHPINCLSALFVKKHVRQWEQDMVNAGFWNRSSLQSGLGDGARHAYLACTLTKQFNGVFAKGLLDAHEEDSSVMFGIGTGMVGNRCCDKTMDLHNNRIGMVLADQPGTCEENVMNSLHLLHHSLCGK